MRWVDDEGRVIRACLLRLEEHAGGEKRTSGPWVLLSVALTRRVLFSVATATPRPTFSITYQDLLRLSIHRHNFNDQCRSCSYIIHLVLKICDKVTQTLAVLDDTW